MTHQAGIFTMDTGYPTSLASMFAPDLQNVVLRGAVMAFQSEHTCPSAATSTWPSGWRCSGPR